MFVFAIDKSLFYFWKIVMIIEIDSPYINEKHCICYIKQTILKQKLMIRQKFFYTILHFGIQKNSIYNIFSIVKCSNLFLV